MSFTILRKITQQNSASALGIQIEEADSAVYVTYAAKSIVFISGGVSTVEFEVSVAGYEQIGIRHIDCSYLGGDNQLEKAEAILKLMIEKADAEADEIATRKQIIADDMALAEEMAKDIEDALKINQEDEYYANK